MAAQYANPWHQPGSTLYGPPMYTTDAPGIPYKGHMLYKIHAAQVDVVRDGVCVDQVVTMRAAKRRIDEGETAQTLTSADVRKLDPVALADALNDGRIAPGSQAEWLALGRLDKAQINPEDVAPAGDPNHCPF